MIYLIQAADAVTKTLPRFAQLKTLEFTARPLDLSVQERTDMLADVWMDRCPTLIFCAISTSLIPFPTGSVQELLVKSAWLIMHVWCPSDGVDDDEYTVEG